MSQTLWFYRELSEQHMLSGLPVKLKTELRSAGARLKALSKSTVDIVYPLPWMLEDKDDLPAWLDFYIDALSFKHEFGARVNLYALDSYLKCIHSLESHTPSPEDLKVLLLEMESPDTFELLEQLEMCADLAGRVPFVRTYSSKINQHHVAQINALWSQAAALSSAEQRLLQATQENKVLLERNETLQIENRNLTEIIHTTQTELQQACVKVKDQSVELEQASVLAAEAVKASEAEISDLKAVKVSAVLPTASVPDADTQAKLQDVQREAKSLLSQLHLCQSELESLQLKHQAMTREVQLSQGVMESASRFILSLKTASVQ